MVRNSLDKFDAVCMATTFHTIATVGAGAESQYKLVLERPEIEKLKKAIGESSVETPITWMHCSMYMACTAVGTSCFMVVSLTQTIATAMLSLIFL